jgi:uncharacterized BrkB/YihY/UPF0761 family membrane protein
MQDANLGGDSRDQPPKPVPETDRWYRNEWNEADKRLLLITFLGGLGANIGLALIVGISIAMIQVAKNNFLAFTILYILILIAIYAVTIYLIHRLAPRIINSFWRGVAAGAGVVAFFALLAYAVYVSK